jgi:hypothetical protein
MARDRSDQRAAARLSLRLKPTRDLGARDPARPAGAAGRSRQAPAGEAQTQRHPGRRLALRSVPVASIAKLRSAAVTRLAIPGQGQPQTQRQPLAGARRAPAATVQIAPPPLTGAWGAGLSCPASVGSLPNPAVPDGRLHSAVAAAAVARDLGAVGRPWQLSGALQARGPTSPIGRCETRTESLDAPAPARLRRPAPTLARSQRACPSLEGDRAGVHPSPEAIRGAGHSAAPGGTLTCSFVSVGSMPGCAAPGGAEIPPRPRRGSRNPHSRSGLRLRT